MIDMEFEKFGLRFIRMKIMNMQFSFPLDLTRDGSEQVGKHFETIRIVSGESEKGVRKQRDQGFVLWLLTGTVFVSALLLALSTART
jgi:hypothetical protein